ncbi:tryptophanyl-tRNA synthetase [Xylariaceae sp. FL0016]|nr:tryptophanyl-tRNA synthetase [Xylariaceae sp. FL0016]
MLCTRCRPLAAVPRQLLRSVEASRRLSSEGKAEDKNAVIFSGIQPTGVPHLGNYLGAMRQWRNLQDTAGDGDKLLYSIVDWHAITMPQDAEILRQCRREMLAALLAIGLNPAKSTMFYQSSVMQHTELMWILSCTASMGYLSRMTQWKSKLSMDNKAAQIDDITSQKLKLGLFSYPVLQAADILVHRATHVPVGDDQRQHLEFARECVTNFNHTYETDTLITPETITTTSPRVMSLQNPLNKMSKSAPNQRSRILITSDSREIRQRIMGAVTDAENIVTYEPLRRPGVSNLLDLLSQCSPNRETPQQLEEMFKGASLKDLKEVVVEAVVTELAGVRDRYEEVLAMRGGTYVDEVEAEAAEKARKSAEETMRFVRYAVGLSSSVKASKRTYFTDGGAKISFKN